MNTTNRRGKGFTLIELLVVVAIVGILSAIVVGSLNVARERARIAASKQFDTSTYRAIGDRAVAYLSFDDCSGATAFDNSGSGNSGTVVNGSWSGTTLSGSGCSMSFNGSSTYVEIPATNIGTGPVTFSAWVKGDAIGNNQERGIITVYSAGAAWFFTLERSSWGNGSFSMYVGYPYQSPNSLSAATAIIWPPSDTNWHHVAMVRDSSSMSLFFDGKMAVSSTNSNFTAFDAGSNPIRVGYPSQYNWLGLIDDVRIYTASLTSAQIERQYAEGATARGVAVFR